MFISFHIHPLFKYMYMHSLFCATILEWSVREVEEYKGKETYLHSRAHCLMEDTDIMR